MRKIKINKPIKIFDIKDAANIFSIAYAASEWGKGKAYDEGSIYNLIKHQLGEVNEIKSGYDLKEKGITHLLQLYEKEKPINLMTSWALDKKGRSVIYFAIAYFRKNKKLFEELETCVLILGFHTRDNPRLVGTPRVTFPKSQITKNSIKLLIGTSKLGKKYHFEDFERESVKITEDTREDWDSYFEIREFMGKEINKKLNKIRKRGQKKVIESLTIKSW